MATATVDTGAHGQWQVVVDLVSQDFASNISFVRVRGIAYNTGSGLSFNNGSIGRSVSGTNGWSGSGSISVPAHGSQTLIDVSFAVGHDGAGNCTVSYTAHLNATGTTNIGGPADASVSLGLTRLASQPAAPSCATSSISSSSALITVTSGGDNRDPITSYSVEVATDPGYTNVVSTGTGTYTATGLTRNTPYYARARATNSYGPSAYSTSAPFTTAATVPDGMAAPTTSNAQPDAVTFAFTPPNNGGSAITGYTLQVSPDSTFATETIQFTPSASPYTATGLTPGTPYSYRIKASNVLGPSGYWSPSATVSTLSGADTRVAGVWHHAKGSTRVAGVWHQAKTWKRAGGVWHL